MTYDYIRVTYNTQFAPNTMTYDNWGRTYDN